MSDTVCNRAELIAGSAPFASFNDHEILALTIMLKAEIAHAANPDIPTDVASLEAAAEGLTTNAGFYRRRRLDARLYLRCLEAVDAGAETDCGDVSALWNKAKCFSCKSDDELEAIRLYLTCAMQLPVGPTFPPDATHYWRLNEASGDSVDEIGGLTLVRGAGVTSVAGPLDNALEVNFAPIGWYLVSDPVAALLPETGGTFSWWQKGSSDPNGNIIIGQASSGNLGDVSAIFQADDAANDSFFNVYDDGDGTSLNLGHLTQPTDGGWHFYTALRRDDGALEFYIDANLIGSQASTVTHLSANKPFVVGTPDVVSPTFAVAIADLGIWPRALSQEEITTLYNGGVPLRP